MRGAANQPNGFYENSANIFTGDPPSILLEAYNILQRLYPGMSEAAWALIAALMRLASNDHHLFVIGAGPVEDFLSRHGPAWIETVEREAAADGKFSFALARCMQAGMADEVWRRVQRASAGGQIDRYFPTATS
jgi:hypothetical protein